jgi:lysophospholipase L1-like esterase
MCTARDADRRTASCTFNVNVTRTPQLNATKIVAFGDSITAGLIATSCPFGGANTYCPVPTVRRLTPAQRLHDLQFLLQDLEASTAAYPRALKTLLDARYLTQSPTVYNEGNAGETAVNGQTRLSGVLNQYRADVLLLQEGINDLNFAGQGAIPGAIDALHRMIQQARGRGMYVFVGTLLPQREGACRQYSCPSVIVSANAQIRTLAISDGAMLVDLYQAFDGQTTTLLGLDGLHPNEAGYQRMAETFFSAVRGRLEVP